MIKRRWSICARDGDAAGATASASCSHETAEGTLHPQSISRLTAPRSVMSQRGWLWVDVDSKHIDPCCSPATRRCRESVWRNFTELASILVEHVLLGRTLPIERILPAARARHAPRSCWPVPREGSTLAQYLHLSPRTDNRVRMRRRLRARRRPCLAQLSAR